MILGGVFLVISGAGLVSLGPSIDEGTAATRPLGPAQATVGVVAESSITFDAKEYTAPAGVVRFDYTGAPGHTLAIRDPQLQQLQVAHERRPELGQGRSPTGRVHALLHDRHARGPGHDRHPHRHEVSEHDLVDHDQQDRRSARREVDPDRCRTRGRRDRCHCDARVDQRSRPAVEERRERPASWVSVSTRSVSLRRRSRPRA